MQIITLDEAERWDEIVKSFPKWDIYFLSEYARSFQIHGDGTPILIYIEHDKAKMAYVMMENDIAAFGPFQDKIQRGKFYDWTTPYGYGGPLYMGDISEEWMQKAMQEIEVYAREHHIVTQFFRYHPLLQNQKWMETVSNVCYVKKTVYMDTESEEIISRNMTPNNRNMVRKAQKNDIEICIDNGERMEAFIEIYKATMNRHNAEEYYYFEKDYFEYIRDEMKDYTKFFYAIYQENVISASIFFLNDRYMHYHLSGTLPEYRNLAAANLLLTEASLWAEKRGIQMLHLGGGVDNEDSLLRFKKHFNRNGLVDFCIGCNIFLPEEFEYLVEKRKEVDDMFDENKPFMIKYRG